MSQLKWDLGVCTYNRPDALEACVCAALKQTRPPERIIVVDASRGWQQTNSAIETACREVSYGGEIVYQPARRKGLTAQRNQVADLARADVVFMIDDDSMMWPDCAEHVMRVYEADPDCVVYGVQAVDARPYTEKPDSSTEDPDGDSEPAPARKRLVARVARFAYKHCSLFRTEGTFVPFLGEFPEHDLPAPVEALGCWSTRHLEGYRMTYRIEALRAEPFTEMLPTQGGEDLEYSYRVSFHGALVTAPSAKLFHDQSPLERDNHYFKAFCRVVNPMVLGATYGRDKKWCKIECGKLVRRRMISEGIKDIASGEFSMPRFRGVFAGARCRREVFWMDPKKLDAWYAHVRETHRG